MIIQSKLLSSVLYQDLNVSNYKKANPDIFKLNPTTTMSLIIFTPKKLKLFITSDTYLDCVKMLRVQVVPCLCRGIIIKLFLNFIIIILKRYIHNKKEKYPATLEML